MSASQLVSIGHHPTVRHPITITTTTSAAIIRFSNLPGLDDRLEALEDLLPDHRVVLASGRMEGWVTEAHDEHDHAQAPDVRRFVVLAAVHLGGDVEGCVGAKWSGKQQTETQETHRLSVKMNSSPPGLSSRRPNIQI